MAIRFSPGACGCCSSYLAYARGVSIPIVGTVGMAISPPGTVSDSFTFGPNDYAVLVSNVDLAADCLLNVFAPAGLGLPIPATPKLIYNYGTLLHALTPGGSYFVTVGGPLGVTETIEFGLFNLSGGRGAWTILGRAIKTVTGTQPLAANFHVNADGTIS